MCIICDHTAAIANGMDVAGALVNVMAFALVISPTEDGAPVSAVECYCPMHLQQVNIRIDAVIRILVKKNRFPIEALKLIGEATKAN